MVVEGRSRTRYRHGRIGAVGTAIPLAALVLVPAVVLVGLAISVHPSGAPGSGTSGAGGLTVAISWSRCLNFYDVVPQIVCHTQPLTVGLSAVVTGGAPPYFFVWNFGDGSSPAFGQIVHHAFPACGLYTVSVLVLSQAGVGSNSTTANGCAIVV